MEHTQFCFVVELVVVQLRLVGEQFIAKQPSIPFFPGFFHVERIPKINIIFSIKVFLQFTPFI